MLNIYRRSAFIYTQAGVSMIEVLVSIIILSIGLLGMAGLQTAGLKAIIAPASVQLLP